MRTHHIALPFSLESVSDLELRDTVYLSGDLVITAGIPTHGRILDHLKRGEPLPIDIAGGAFFHLGCFSRDDGKGGLEILYMNPTTSTRFNPVMPAIIRGFQLRAVGGKGGLDQASAQAMAEVGCVYLSFLGGGAPIHTDAIRSVRNVAWNDLIAHYRLVKLEVAELGPLTVGIDARGNSVYADLQQQSQARLPDILARLRVARGEY